MLKCVVTPRAFCQPFGVREWVLRHTPRSGIPAAFGESLRIGHRRRERRIEPVEHLENMLAGLVSCCPVWARCTQPLTIFVNEDVVENARSYFRWNVKNGAIVYFGPEDRSSRILGIGVPTNTPQGSREGGWVGWSTEPSGVENGTGLVPAFAPRPTSGGAPPDRGAYLRVQGFFDI